ncbi:hypothetical protein COZ71_04630, partial [Candidatus Desantisbacteria bacterium CG_4_8_14_3_um_filter_40_12]
MGIAKDTYRWTYCIASISHKKRLISEKTGRIFQLKQTEENIEAKINEGKADNGYLSGKNLA